jgi:hypothetical protein
VEREHRGGSRSHPHRKAPSSRARNARGKSRALASVSHRPPRIATKTRPTHFPQAPLLESGRARARWKQLARDG